MSHPSGRPALKLKLSTAAHVPTLQSLDSATTPSSGGAPKIKLKIGGGSKPATPSEGPSSSPFSAKDDKKAKKPKTTVRLATNGSSSAGSKKRGKAGDDDGEGTALQAKQRVKKLKLSHHGPVTPIIRAKLKGKPPARPLGVGYDSEASDRENDPHIEEEFVLRMTPGDDCDYLRKAIDEKRLGLPKREGGADVSLKFLNRDGRRALVTVRQRQYAATMVDLPCVVEGMKSWDRRGWWKSADICQMLLVLGPVASEEQARTMALPPQVDPKTYQYPHGLTPPMHNVRRNRFRKRVSNRTIEAVEDEVERLLAADRECQPGSSSYEIVDLERLTRDNSAAQSDEGGYGLLGNAGMHEAEYDDDAEGEVDDGSYFGGYDQDGEALEADLEMAMMMDDDATTATTPVEGPVATPGGAVPGAANGVTAATTPSVAEDSGDESSDGDDADEDGPDEIDEDALARQKDLAKQQEEMADLASAIRGESAKLDTMTNPLFRARQMEKIRSLKADLELKRGGAGDDED
ncbi:MAG: hypothetical protein M1832_001327 [Thelocarpon impressellum]|nr:MAG: hypothetical protein M1832_001327 [Thelocarpon impressellum]